MARYKDPKGRIWKLVRRLPGGRLDLFCEETGRFMLVNAATAKTFEKVI